MSSLTEKKHWRGIMEKEKVKCLICGKEYNLRFLGHHTLYTHSISPEIYYLDYLKNIKKECPICKKTPRFMGIPNGYKTYCSQKCLIVAMKTDEELKKRNQKTLKEAVFKKYGVENVFQADWCKEKMKQTLLTKYGVDSPIKNKEISNKIKQTNLERYGVENPFQSEEIIKTKILPNKDYKEIRKKSKQTNLERYGVENYFQTEESKAEMLRCKHEAMIDSIFSGDRLKNKVIPLFAEKDYINVYTEYKFKCSVCNHEFMDDLDAGHIPRCPKCFPYVIYSKNEYTIIDYIKSITNEEVKHGDRKTLHGFELDVYIPTLNLAIEYNGLYYHSEITGGKSSEYHLNKTLSCESKNIQLIHIFANEWLYDMDRVKQFLKDIIYRKEILLDNSVGITKTENNYILDKRWHNLSNKFSQPLKCIEVLPPKKHFVDDQHLKVVDTPTNDWIWDCGYLKCVVGA